ncbi:unnamed protein product [Euphydryas editha]|uniref:Uncharacterized protein n=1 Tax=Euphydryas editha TaxID=104508 RepID=A0AAU9UMP6_EUPED|nr:unnamed protein product [Euphydryas editha]
MDCLFRGVETGLWKDLKVTEMWMDLVINSILMGVETSTCRDVEVRGGVWKVERPGGDWYLDEFGDGLNT